jgi:hypothetical protein
MWGGSKSISQRLKENLRRSGKKTYALRLARRPLRNIAPDLDRRQYADHTSKKTLQAPEDALWDRVTQTLFGRKRPPMTANKSTKRAIFSGIRPTCASRDTFVLSVVKCSLGTAFQLRAARANGRNGQPNLED